MEDQMRRLGYFPRIEAVSHGGKAKTDRVVWALQGRFERGVITLKKAPWNREFISQLLDFPNPLSHDDLVDSLAYTDQVAITPYEQSYQGEIPDEYQILDVISGY
jgi:predicted phage terminase large subunit-like protein